MADDIVGRSEAAVIIIVTAVLGARHVLVFFIVIAVFELPVPDLFDFLNFFLAELHPNKLLGLAFLTFLLV